MYMVWIPFHPMIPPLRHQLFTLGHYCLPSPLPMGYHHHHHPPPLHPIIKVGPNGISPPSPPPPQTNALHLAGFNCCCSIHPLCQRYHTQRKWSSWWTRMVETHAETSSAQKLLFVKLISQSVCMSVCVSVCLSCLFIYSLILLYLTILLTITIYEIEHNIRFMWNN